MNEPRVYDSIVIGAGIMGSCSAFHFAKAGKRTLLLEQFNLPHTRGSSSGKSRIIRKAYASEHMAKMMPEAYELWDYFENCSKRPIMRHHTLVYAESAPMRLAACEKNMKTLNLPYELLDHQGLAKQFPMLRFPPPYSALIDGAAGLLMPDTCLRVIQDEFEKEGGEIKDEVQVKKIIPGTPVRIQTNQGEFVAQKVVVNAGPWTSELLQSVGIVAPLKVMKGMATYWKLKSDDPQDNIPLFVDMLPVENGYAFVYGMPCHEYPGLVKLGTRFEPPLRYCHPDERDMGHEDEVYISKIASYIRDHLPTVNPDHPRIREPCLYTMTPDKDFIIDYHPTCKNIVIGAGFSGTGFKLAPVIGKLMFEMAEGKRPSYDVTPFRLSRFQNTSKL